MKHMNRREFMKNTSLALAGGLIFPGLAFASNPVKIKKGSFIDRIIRIESGYDNTAYNTKSKARGLMQITPIVLKEWNEFNPKEKYSKNKLFDPEVNIKIGKWYLFPRIANHYLPFYELNKDVPNILTAWDWGIGNLVNLKGNAIENLHRLPKETNNYIKEFISMY